MGNLYYIQYNLYYTLFFEGKNFNLGKQKLFCAHSTSPTCALNLCSVAGKYLRTPAPCLFSLSVSSALLTQPVHLLEVAQPKYKYTKKQLLTDWEEVIQIGWFAPSQTAFTDGKQRRNFEND